VRCVALRSHSRPIHTECGAERSGAAHAWIGACLHVIIELTERNNAVHTTHGSARPCVRASPGAMGGLRGRANCLLSMSHKSFQRPAT